MCQVVFFNEVELRCKVDFGVTVLVGAVGDEERRWGGGWEATAREWVLCPE